MNLSNTMLMLVLIGHQQYRAEERLSSSMVYAQLDVGSDKNEEMVL